MNMAITILITVLIAIILLGRYALKEGQKINKKL
jgi:hypothetical protein